MARITTIVDDEGNEIELATKWEICGCCNGHGKSSRYLGAITQGDREPGGAWDDPDAFEDYMRGGYDRHCDECDGSGKVRVVDYARLLPGQSEALQEVVNEEREYRAAVAAERRFGC